MIEKHNGKDRIIKDDPTKLMSQGRVASNVPVILGYNKDEVFESFDLTSFVSKCSCLFCESRHFEFFWLFNETQKRKNTSNDVYVR